MNQKDGDKEVEIDLLELAKKLWSGKWFILKFGLFGAVIGLIIAFSIPKKYTSSVLIATESQNSSGSGNVSALASLAGINLNASAGDIFTPAIYPEVLNSTPFIQELLKIRVVDVTQSVDTTLYEYLRSGQKKAWWSYILQIPSLMNLSTSDDVSDDLIEKDKYFLSKGEISTINYLRSMYSINTDKKTALTTLEVSSQSSKISAFLADTIMSYLQHYIIVQRTKKAKLDLSNSEALYDQAKLNYYKSQQNLALFVDGNQNVISAKYRINQERLQNEVNLAYSVYNQMAQQVQMNRIKVQDDTPVFTIIQPAVQFLYPIFPNKKLIIVVCVLLFSLLSSSYILINEIVFKQKINEKGEKEENNIARNESI